MFLLIFAFYIFASLSFTLQRHFLNFTFSASLSQLHFLNFTSSESLLSFTDRFASILEYVIYLYINLYTNLQQMAPTTRKRKASADLSTNPHTTKARNRTAKMEGYELQIEMAKNADRGAIAYALRKLQKTKEWIAADPDTQATMKEDSYNAVVHKR